MLVQRTKKLTRKEALQMADKAAHLLNVLMGYELTKWFDGCFKKDMDKYWIFGDVLVKQIPTKPLVHMPDFESNPGVWVYEDTETKVVWMIYSDCHKKNAYKGTSFEPILPPYISTEDVKKSISTFFSNFNVGFKEQL